MNKTLLHATVGSHAYGTAHKDSDMDSMTVFAAPTILVADASYDTYHKAIPGGDDITLYEVGHFISLLTKASPNVIEFAHLNHSEISDEGQAILENLPAFLGRKKVYDTYTNVIESQIRYLEKQEKLDMREDKVAKHVWRFGLQGLDLLRKGYATPLLTETEKIDYAGVIAAPPKMKADVLRHLRSRYDEDFISPLKEEQNFKRINSVLHFIRAMNT